MRITKPTNNANISLLLIVAFLIVCMVNNAYSFNQPVLSSAQLTSAQLDNVPLNSLTSTNESVNSNADFSAVTNTELTDASYLDNSDGACKLTEKLLQKASTHMDELVMVILMIILFSHYFTRQTPNFTYLANTFVPSRRRHLILCKFEE
ncbi:Putative uncharacterized protein [Moritella viscosa]|uniref:Uncharacterized protein n=1 Tax=Moritella viscosa TaxID=80854 RepID=A0A090IBK3_9GAMM|nr:hypothetical protein [Moritella viscosa]CED59430.1 membrane protein [Moritella viscosa]SGY89420.1 Putative uncharacterized protein [Moritella viscosa]SHO00672.1 Putative uncharacterized protein [Moritella viscosa]SHO00993.1 Putative uncharacterized protein [Moritella viscosa]SHO01563.1 Putative uncharacterized protein [Moritella viscosa]